MEKIINKRFCLVYDTFKEMIQDPDISSGMIAMTLGYESSYDEGYTIYKIVKKESLNGKKINGRSFGINSPYYAVRISDSSSSDIHDKINENTDLIKSLGSTIDSSMYRQSTTVKAENTKNPNEILNELYLDADNHVRVVQLSNGRRYIVSDGDGNSIYNITIALNETNAWLIPSEFVVSNYAIDTLCINKNNHIDYMKDNSLLFTLNLCGNISNVIPY